MTLKSARKGIQFPTPTEVKRVKWVRDYVMEDPCHAYVVATDDVRFLLRVIAKQEECINHLLAGYSVRLPRTKKIAEKKT